MQLNDRQLEAVQHGNSPLLILAGAGTGKTTTIVNRIEYVVKNNFINSEDILALTFSVEATETLKNRLFKRGEVDVDSITISTFHSFAKSIIEENYSKLGYASPPILVEKDDLVYLFLDKINSFNYFKSRRYNRFPVKAIKSLLSIHDQFCQELFSIKDLDSLRKKSLEFFLDSLDEDDEPYRQIYDAINTFEEFKNFKKELSLIEYEDMIYDIWSLINSDSKILSLLEDKFKFIIIDEFQDNNFAFSEIINKIASHENITVVGDDDQSIYSFRGANSYNMHDFHKLYSSNPNYKKIELIKNYRSSQKILDVANSVIVNNDNRMEKEFLVSGIDIIKEDLVELCIGDFNSQLAELLKHIQALIKQNDNKSFAILCRTHFDCISISNMLNKHHISHNYNNDKLFDQKIIKDAIAVLNVVVYSKYTLHSLIRLSRDVFNGNFIKKILDINNWSNNLLLDCVNSKEIFTNDELLWLKKIASISKKNFINDLFNIVCDDELSDFNIELIENFEEIFKKFNMLYAKNTIKNFCNYINLIFDNNIPVNIIKGDGKYSVDLMTVHNSKGMEFDYVFLPFLQSSKFPQSNKSPQFISNIPVVFKKWNTKAVDQSVYHIEEERRLFYVAVTRAKEKLYLLTTPMRQSRFIKEIANDLYESKSIDIKIGLNKDIYSETFLNNNIKDLKLSASKMDVYNRCPLQYKYANLDLIPSFEHNSLFALGNIVHKVLQKFHENNLKSYSSMVELLKEYWNKELYFYQCESNQYYKDAKGMLENYAYYLKDNKASPILLESFFKIEMENYILSGVIDRLDIGEEGDLVIYDYKTSKVQKSQSQIKSSFQLPIYALAVYTNGNSMSKNIKNGHSPIFASELSVRFLDMSRKVEFSKLDIVQIKESINDLAKEMSSNIFKAKPSFTNCTYCDYKRFICSYYD